MKVYETYSHLNGLEYLHFHKKNLIKDIFDSIEAVDAELCRTKISKERKKQGRRLYSPIDMNRAFSDEFRKRGWKEKRNNAYVVRDQNLARKIISLSAEQQRQIIEQAGEKALFSYNQTDFVKDRVAVEVQFGKYSFVAHDLFVKHMSFFVSNQIDVGVEILPMKSLEQQMSSGVAYYERDLFNVLRQGRGSPAVPLVLFGIAP